MILLQFLSAVALAQGETGGVGTALCEGGNGSHYQKITGALYHWYTRKFIKQK